MNVITNKRILNFFLDVISTVSVFLAISCATIKISSSSLLNQENFDILAAKSVFFRSDSVHESQLRENNKDIANIEIKNNMKEKIVNNNTCTPIEMKDNILPEIEELEDESAHSSEEKKCTVIEKSINSGGTKCENFYVKNTTGCDINLNEYLNIKPSLKIRETSEPQVLIMHTHTSESYLPKDLGFFYENFYPRSLDPNRNVTKVGQLISQTLIKNGINTIHSTVYHDSPTYNGSYSRAAQTIKENLEKYPSIQMVIDIHRDSMGSKELGKIKPTFKYGDKKASQIMIISGCDPDGSVGFPNWEKNLSLALNLQKYCETMFPGITRPMKFAKVKYNEHLTPGSILIEVGSDVNTIRESSYTGLMLGESISKLLNDLKKQE